MRREMRLQEGRRPHRYLATMPRWWRPTFLKDNRYRPDYRGVPSVVAFTLPPIKPLAVRPPQGDDWLHKPQWDDFRFQVIKDGGDVRLYSKSGAE
jgi:ATP-dependent DNA ligase